MSAPDVDDPSNWVEAQDPASGRSYWINKATNETSWTPPQQVNTEGDGAEWEEVQDATSGKTYFVNKTSRRATWSRPELNQLLVQERFFRYVDKRGKEQGPFPESKMQEWFGDGYFKVEVKCKEETSSTWATIGTFFGDYSPNTTCGRFTLSPYQKVALFTLCSAMLNGWSGYIIYKNVQALK